MKTYHLTKTDKGWEVRAEGADRATLTSTTKAEALQKFRETVAHKATQERPMSLRIHKTDGKIQEERTYPRSADPKASKG
ncbi:MAG: DUF2188 domain-containing protein [Bacteroidia bacterium]|nr:DUF2188 domain-containing protein [Bacteroidia bacterium]